MVSVQILLVYASAGNDTLSRNCDCHFIERAIFENEWSTWSELFTVYVQNYTNVNIFFETRRAKKFTAGL